MANHPIWIECDSDAYKDMKKFGGKKEVTFDIFCGTSAKNSNLAGKVTISLGDSLSISGGHLVEIRVNSKGAHMSTSTDSPTTVISVLESCNEVDTTIGKEWDKDWNEV
tara:strand:- start:4832 stop:5158 length:327 start_codon:yes stop_codon:yes gene_type:complete